MRKKTKDYKKCPRCKEKLDLFAPICPICGLRFSKVNLATNKAAKVAIKEKRKHHVIYVDKRPSDVSKVKFIISLIFGWMGMHNIYLGKYFKGWFAFSLFWSYMTIFITCATLVDNGYMAMHTFSVINYVLLSTIALAFAIMLILWFDDILSVIFGRFKYPVSIPKEVQVEAILKDDDNQKQDKNNVEDENNDTSNAEVIINNNISNAEKEETSILTEDNTSNENK